MAGTNIQNPEIVLDQIREWSPQARLTLAQRILQTLQSEVGNESKQRKSLRDLVGLVRLDREPPTDDECRVILEDELLRKHG